MALIGITSVVPDTGPARGRLMVQIVGTGFRVTPAPSASGPSGPVDDRGIVHADYQRTVKVEFNGVESPDVRVLSDALLRVMLPSYRGNGDVSAIDPVAIRVTNLDDDGLEIPGESYTKFGAFTYERPQLDGTEATTAVAIEILRQFKRQVHPNTSLTTHTDFDEDVSDALDITAVAELPAIVLGGPDARRNRFYSINGEQEYEDLIAGYYTQLAQPRTVDLVFAIAGVHNSTRVVLNLMHSVNQFFEANKWLELDRNPDDPAAGRVRYEMDIEDEMSVQSRPNESNVRHFVGSFVIRGFDVELDQIDGTSETADEVDLSFESM